MVDSIGSKVSTPPVDRRVAPVAAAPSAQAAQVVATAKDQTSRATQAQAQSATVLAQSMAAEAPVDMDRVMKIKKAVEDGRFPIYPATIADRLLALKMQWTPNDPA